MVKRVHSKNPVKTVGAALSLLEHSFRLQWGFRQGFIQNDCFTLKVDIPSGTGTHLVARKFDKEQLELEFHNQILIALCALAISVDKALDSTFGSKESKNTGEVVNAIRAIFYQLRCAWAHDVINPKWNRKENKYKGLYRVVVPSEIVSKATYGRLNQSKIYEFNFEELNGKYVNFVPFWRNRWNFLPYRLRSTVNCKSQSRCLL